MNQAQMDTNKMREQFEIFAADMGWGSCLSRKDENYSDWSVNPMWIAWKTSREALVVELPKFDEYPASMEREMRESLRSAIEAQGLKVKP